MELNQEKKNNWYVTIMSDNHKISWIVWCLNRSLHRNIHLLIMKSAGLKVSKYRGWHGNTADNDEIQVKSHEIQMKSAKYWWNIHVYFHSLSFNSTKLHGNIFLNYYLASLADSPTCVIFLITLDRFGRKWNLVFFQVRPSFSPIWQPWNFTSPRSEKKLKSDSKTRGDIIYWYEWYGNFTKFESKTCSFSVQQADTFTINGNPETFQILKCQKCYKYGTF